MFNPAFTKSPSLRCAWRWGEVVSGPDQGDQRVVLQPGGQHEPLAVDPRPQAEIPTKPRRRLGDPADLVVFIDVPLDQLQLAEPGGLRLSGADRDAHDLQVDGEVRRKSCQEPLRDLIEQQVRPGVRNVGVVAHPVRSQPSINWHFSVVRGPSVQQRYGHRATVRPFPSPRQDSRPRPQPIAPRPLPG